jgi:predicted TIM-barrel fold metal-dependent hydrolase
LRGIAVVDPAIDDGALAGLDADGVVGIRLNLDGAALPDFRKGPWPRLLRAIGALGWHVETHRVARDLPSLVGPLLDAGLDVVVDHFGRPDDDLGADDPGFRYLLAQGASRRLWVKLSGAYRNGSGGRGDAAAPALAARLLEHVGADRLVWGSDWPHTRHESSVDLATTRRALAAWVPDRADRERIDGANALALYRFDA